MKTIEIDATFSEKEFRHARARAGLTDLMITPVILAIYAFYVTPHLVNEIEKGKGWESFPIYLLMLAGFLLYPAYMFYKYYISSNKIYRKNTFLSEGSYYSFNEDTLQWKGSERQGEYHWDNLVRALETKRFFLLYISKKSVILLPKRAFGDRLEEFKDLLTRKLGKQAKLKKKERNS